MILIYSIYNIICIFIGKNIFNSWFNPLSVYSLAWEISVGLHESGLIEYYELSTLCWVVIFFLQTIFVCGCYFGRHIKHDKTPCTIDMSASRRELKKYIVITTCIAGIAILGNLVTVIGVYGENLLKNFTNIYADRVHQTREIETIPYLGAFIFITMPLSGIYVRRHGFSIFIIPSFVLAFISALTSGGRAGIVFSIVLFGSAFFLTNRTKPHIDIRDKTEKKREKRRKLVLYCLVAILVGMVIVLTNSRNAGVTPAYASDTYKAIFGNNVLAYKIIEYLSSPVGVLNEYLKNMEVHFGQNTFLPVFNVLSKFGICERPDQYQEFFAVPIYTNVGTWLRELIEDFSLPGATIGVFIYASVTSVIITKAKESMKSRDIIPGAVLMMILSLTFFDWRLRSSDMWISIFFGYIIGILIDRKITGRES